MEMSVVEKLKYSKMVLLGSGKWLLQHGDFAEALCVRTCLRARAYVLLEELKGYLSLFPNQFHRYSLQFIDSRKKMFHFVSFS